MNGMHSSDSESQIMVFTGNANPKLAQAVVEHLQLSLGAASVGSFSDGEVQVEIDENVRGKDVFVMQPTAGIKFINGQPGCECLVVGNNGLVAKSNGWRA